MSRRIFGCLINYPKIGYAMNPHPLTIDSDYDKVHMNYYYGNKYVYFSQYIDDQISEPLID